MATSHTITVDPEVQQLLEDIAASELRSPEFVVRDAIVEYAARREPLSPEDRQAIEEHDAIWDSYNGPKLTEAEVLAEAEEASEHYKKTGLHLTHEEVDAWLKRLQAGEDIPPPPCHT
jgi:predicted transcriptional regulator